LAGVNFAAGITRRFKILLGDFIMTDTAVSSSLHLQPITADFFYSQLRVAFVAIVSYGGGAHWFTPEQAGLYMALFTSIGPIAVPWAWSVFANFGKVFVDRNSAAAVVAKVEVEHPVLASKVAVSLAQKVAA
jgi:hypothetical protein